MEQIGFVKEIIDNRAKVEVARANMCEGCSKKECSGECTVQDMFVSNKKVTVVANNEVGAKVGDKVLIQSETSTILKYAAIVFLVPTILFIAAYLITINLSKNENLSLIVSIATFILCFVFIGIYEKIVSKRRSSVDIIKVIGESEE